MFAPMYPAHTRDINYLWQNSTNDQYSDVNSPHIANANLYKFDDNDIDRSAKNNEKCREIVVSRDKNTWRTDNAVCMYGKHNVASNYVD